MKIILDAAASQFFEKGSYKIERKKINSKELPEYYLRLIKKYPILGLEDPFSEEDWMGWRRLKS
ncbi:MAG: phosphopyruvate hydratase, partial [Ignavibacteria bacterium]